MSSLTGKVIAITGAASGIGLATARLLAQQGAFLSLADINESRLEEVAAELHQQFSPHFMSSGGGINPVLTTALDVDPRRPAMTGRRGPSTTSANLSRARPISPASLETASGRRSGPCAI